MGRKKLENPKVPMCVSVRQTTKDHIRENNINAGEILDSMFNPEIKDYEKGREKND